MSWGMPGRRGTALTAIAVAAAVLTGFTAYRIFAPAGRTARAPLEAVRQGPAGISGGSDSSIRAAAAPQRPIPETLPDFSLATPEGPPRALSSFTAPSLVVNFWATWCAPCRREIPLLRQLQAERRTSGVEVVGIAVDFRPDVLKFARETGLDYPLLIGEQDGFEAAQAFGMDLVFPFTVFADSKKRIVALKVGELHRNEAEFILDMIAGINAGRLPLAQARTAIAAKLRLLAADRESAAAAPAATVAPPGN